MDDMQNANNFNGGTQLEILSDEALEERVSNIVGYFCNNTTISQEIKDEMFALKNYQLFLDTMVLTIHKCVRDKYERFYEPALFIAQNKLYTVDKDDARFAFVHSAGLQSILSHKPSFINRKELKEYYFARKLFDLLFIMTHNADNETVKSVAQDLLDENVAVEQLVLLSQRLEKIYKEEIDPEYNIS